MAPKSSNVFSFMCPLLCLFYQYNAFRVSGGVAVRLYPSGWDFPVLAKLSIYQCLVLLVLCLTSESQETTAPVG